MTPDIVIIGAGVVGLSTACSLARRGARVTIVEKGPIGRESSWAGAGILSALLPWDYPQAVNQLMEEGRLLWPAWAEELKQRTGVDPEYRLTGMLVMNIAQPEIALQWCSGHAWRHHMGQSDLADLLPGSDDCHAMRLEGTGSHLWLPDVAQIRNPRLLQGLVRLARQLGVTLLENQGTATVRPRNGQVHEVLSGQMRLPCTHAVICAGAWSSSLLPTPMAGVPIKPIRGQILLFRDAPGHLPYTLVKDGKYLVPRQDGHILAGSTLEDAGFDKSTTRQAYSELLAFARLTLPWLANTEPVTHWAGLRPGSPGNVPIIARHPQVDNLYMNSGHFRYGVTMAPASAERLSCQILNTHSACDSTTAATEYPWPAHLTSVSQAF